MKHLKKFENFNNEENEWVTFKEYGGVFKVDDDGYLTIAPLLRDGTISNNIGEISSVCSDADIVDEEFLKK